MLSLQWSKHFELHRGWSQRRQLPRHVHENLLEQVVLLDNTTLAYSLADVNVTLHDVVERRVVDSAGFFANDTWLEKHSRNGNVRGDSDDVSV